MSDTEQLDYFTEEADGLPERTSGLRAQMDAVAKQAEGLREQANVINEKGDRLTEKSQWSNWGVLAVIVLCFFVIVHFGKSNRPGTQQPTGIGQTLPQLRLRSLTGGGRRVTLADLTGRVVLINFWGTWSSPSRAGLPHLADIQKKFAGHPAFMLLAVSCGQTGKESLRLLRTSTQALLEREDINLPTYADPGGVSRSAVNRVVGFNRFPTTLILDRRGRVRGVWVGFDPAVEGEMQQLISRLLDET